jgi:hypothetical protein
MYGVEKVEISERGCDMAETIAAAEPAAGLERALAHLLRSGEAVWLVEQRYEAPTSSWIVGIVRQGSQGRWVRRRYRYDSIVDVLFFLGERQLSDRELASAQAAGKQVDSL